MALALALTASLIALVFAASLAHQYLKRGRRPYNLVWAIGLFLYFAGAGFWFLREALGINEWIFRLWYLTGAMLVPAYLGTGTLYLLARRSVANSAMAALVAITVASFVLVLLAGIRTPADCPTLFKGLECLGPDEPLTGSPFLPIRVRVLTIVLNAYGTIALVGGAIWSGWQLAQKLLAKGRGAPERGFLQRRLISNALIAAGAIISALGGSLEGAGIPQPHLVALLAGVVVIYAGFLASSEVFETYPFASLRRALSLGRRGNTYPHRRG